MFNFSDYICNSRILVMHKCQNSKNYLKDKLVFCINSCYTIAIGFCCRAHSMMSVSYKTLILNSIILLNRLRNCDIIIEY